MWTLLARLFRPPPQDQVVLNLALELAQEWGADAGKPVTPRLRERYPWVSERQLQGVEEAVQAAMTAAHATIRRLAAAQGQMPSQAAFRREFGRSHPWVNARNLHRLYTQGCYFAAR